jgi:flagellar biosynthesis protein FliP
VKLIRSAIMAGIAKKVYDEARKPENQQKIKDLIAQASNRAKARPTR